MERWLKVGEVARLTGLTVRTLHHYDQIGLLVPSGRSTGDYRLYDEGDLRRLLAIGHLKSLGLSLEEIATALDEPSHDPRAVLAQHIEATRARLSQEQELLTRLERLQERSEWDDVVAAIELTERLAHPDPLVRVRAAMEAPEHAPLEDLVEGLRTEDQPSVREMLTWAVAQHGTAATDQVVAHLDDPDPHVRLQMAHVLSKLHDRSAVPALADLLDDPDQAVATKAAFALGQLGGHTALTALVGHLGEGDDVHRDTLVTAIARSGPAALPMLAADLGGSPAARIQKADALGYLGHADAAPLLAELAADPVPEVALAAVMALGSTPGEEAIDALRRALGSEDPRTRLVAERLFQARLNDG